MPRAWPLAFALVALAGCGGGPTAGGPPPDAPSGIRLASPAFRSGGPIPGRFTCAGDDVSPPLRWLGVPSRARSLALVMDDEDAKGFVHWTVLDLPPRARGLSEARVPPGATETENSFGDQAYGGPCPPGDDPPHRYRFVLYALSKRLVLARKVSPDDVREAIRKTALARGRLTGTFGR
jgi:Raf kinase inhibitor-like YbhB/YbcL family protein